MKRIQYLIVSKLILVLVLSTISLKSYCINQSDSITITTEELKLATKLIVERNYYKSLSLQKDDIILLKNEEIRLLEYKISKYVRANDLLNKQLHAEKLANDKLKKQRNTYIATTTVGILAIILTLCLK